MNDLGSSKQSKKSSIERPCLKAVRLNCRSIFILTAKSCASNASFASPNPSPLTTLWDVFQRERVQLRWIWCRHAHAQVTRSFGAENAALRVLKAVDRRAFASQVAMSNGVQGSAGGGRRDTILAKPAWSRQSLEWDRRSNQTEWISPRQFKKHALIAQLRGTHFSHIYKVRFFQ
jgi:hypothetical protein